MEHGWIPAVPPGFVRKSTAKAPAPAPAPVAALPPALEKDAADAEAYASVRVRKPKRRYQDEVYVDRDSSRRTGAYAVCGSSGSSNPRAHREEEARREAEAPSQAASDDDNAADLETRAAAGQPPLTADEARAAAAAEGLELVPSSSGETGFKGVRKHSGSCLLYTSPSPRD